MKTGDKIELWFYLVGWVIETLLIKYWIGVESWVVSILLAVTVGSLLLYGLQHVPDLLD